MEENLLIIPLINNYMNENNVKLINGLPYNPRSQGIIERLHLTIRNNLLAIYLEEINSFNIESSLHKVMNNYYIKVFIM